MSASTGTVDTLWSTYLKGAHGHRREILVIDPVVGVMDDRRAAIRRKPGDMTVWAPKAAFYVCMNTPRMAAERPKTRLSGLDPIYVKDLRRNLGLKDDLLVQVATNDYSLHDTKGAFVSFVNLASVRALSDHMGVHIDPRRFRMNVWLTGLEPFEELTWVNRYPGSHIIEIGEVRFRVDDACERCKAPNASPETGEYDFPVLEYLGEMMKKRGYKSPHRGVPHVMGILAQPLSGGVIRRGDPIQLL